MGGTASRVFSRRSFVAAGAAGVGALALRPRRTVAEVLDPRSPAGLWGVARTDDGLVGLWSSGGRPVVVRLTDRGRVSVVRTLGSPPTGTAVAVAGGGAHVLLGAEEVATPAVAGIATSHLPPSVQAALAGEVDGPLSVAGVRDLDVQPRWATARTLDGAVALDLPDIPGGIASAALLGDVVWSVVQHPPSAEGDHCSSLTVSADGRPVLELADLGDAGAASLAGPASGPIASVADGDGRLRLFHLAGGPVELVAPGTPDDVAVHVADGRPIALLASPDGATLLRHTGAGWDVVRDVAGTAGSTRVLAVAGAEPAFLVEATDGVLYVDGDGTVR